MAVADTDQMREMVNKLTEYCENIQQCCSDLWCAAQDLDDSMDGDVNAKKASASLSSKVQNIMQQKENVYQVIEALQKEIAQHEETTETNFG